MMMHGPTITIGTAGDDLLMSTRGGIRGLEGDDVMMATAQRGFGQIHTFGFTGDDQNIMSFNNITSFSHGHHVRGGEGFDTFSFVDTNQVSATIVGRIEDFDITHDKILIEGQELDFNNLPSNVRIVEYNGEYHDTDAVKQQWLLIETSAGGTIFYALEGARVDMTTTDAQEGHFLLHEPDFDSLVDVQFQDAENYIPAGFEPWGGARIEDVDVVRADVLEVIHGTNGGDLISGGLNDDRIMASFGHDRIWTGSGDDFAHGGVGNDTLSGGSGDDTLRAGSGADSVSGGDGNDFIVGGAGADTLEGGDGNDVIMGAAGFDVIEGGDGNDTIEGGHRNDTIDGGPGRDILTGGTHRDTFHFDDFDWGFDVITDFEVNHDYLSFSGAVDGADHIILMNYQYNGQASTLIRFADDTGDMQTNMGGVVLADVTASQISVDDFLF